MLRAQANEKKLESIWEIIQVKTLALREKSRNKQTNKKEWSIKIYSSQAHAK